MERSCLEATDFGSVGQSDADFSSLTAGIAIGGSTDGTGGGVMPVALAMTSRKRKYLGVVRPLSSSGAS